MPALIEPGTLRRAHAADAEAAASPHGGQLLSWRVDGIERLYLSPRADASPGQAIRGGVPVIFPQFGHHGPGSRHGFARLRDWTPVSPTAPSTLAFRLAGDAAASPEWPHRPELTMGIALEGRQCRLSLEVANAGDTAFSFTAALHTYLRVDGLRDTRLEGLEHCPFIDGTREAQPCPPSHEALAFEGEVDRIYPAVPGRLALASSRQKVHLEQDGFQDIVVWNPGRDLAAAMADLGAGEHEHFVCVEAACICVPVSLRPGETWTGSQHLSIA